MFFIAYFCSAIMQTTYNIITIMEKWIYFETRLKHLDVLLRELVTDAAVLSSTALYDGLRLLFPAKDVFILFTSLL